jgi:tetratricopeptide (TPR) repeat protein
MLGDAAGEMDELLKAIDLDPRYVDARLNLAFSLIRRGRHLEAIRALRQVLGMDEGNLRARLELGNALANVGKAAEALGELERLSREAPAWPPAHNALARLHLAGGRRAEARREAEASLALNPDQPAMRALLEEAGGPAATSGSKP